MSRGRRRTQSFSKAQDPSFQYPALASFGSKLAYGSALGTVSGVRKAQPELSWLPGCEGLFQFVYDESQVWRQDHWSSWDANDCCLDEYLRATSARVASAVGPRHSSPRWVPHVSRDTRDASDSKVQVAHPRVTPTKPSPKVRAAPDDEPDPDVVDRRRPGLGALILESGQEEVVLMLVAQAGHDQSLFGACGRALGVRHLIFGAVAVQGLGLLEAVRFDDHFVVGQTLDGLGARQDIVAVQVALLQRVPRVRAERDFVSARVASDRLPREGARHQDHAPQTVPRMHLGAHAHVAVRAAVALDAFALRVTRRSERRPV